MKVSVIISVYKDTQALALILKSLQNQTHVPDEIIVSEDGQDNEMAKFLQSYPDVVHVSQEDNGWHKNRALNNAINHSNGEYLIFIDGDVVPYHRFVENHLKLIEKNHLLFGKRIELGKYISLLLRKRVLSVLWLERLFWLFLPLIVLDKGSRHVEDGLIFGLKSRLGKKSRSKINRMIIGCNFSCWKSDIIKINGFDEDYITPTVGEDLDLLWRFQGIGVKKKSVRNFANIFHLWHPRRWDSTNIEVNRNIMQNNKKQNKFFCDNGLVIN